MEELPEKNEAADDPTGWKDESYRSSIVPDELPPEFQARTEAALNPAPERLSAGTRLAHSSASAFQHFHFRRISIQ
ncbi:MAG TPA: hypothetical protein VNQ79_23365 [Blastocatellia bacterium]|nr:hypothetical protein [Blastocatellia bacterium]